jgi:hypothetical protein
MIKKILLAMTLLLSLSCKKDDSDISTKQEKGSLWFSGGLAVCAEQIHLDNGDTLIVNIQDVITFRTGDRVEVKYKEIGINEECSPAIDCEIIEIRKIVQ